MKATIYQHKQYASLLKTAGRFNKSDIVNDNNESYIKLFQDIADYIVRNESTLKDTGMYDTFTKQARDFLSFVFETTDDLARLQEDC